MSQQPLAIRPILNPSVVKVLNQAASNYDLPSNKALKSKGVNSEMPSRFIAHISTFACVLAENCTRDVNCRTVYGLSNSTSEIEQELMVAHFFFMCAVHLVLPDDHPLIPVDIRLFGTGSEGIRRFVREEIYGKIVALGGSEDSGIDLMSVVCSAINKESSHSDRPVYDIDKDDGSKFLFDRERFVLLEGKMVRQAAAKANTEFGVWVSHYNKMILNHGRPRPGHTWPSSLRSLFVWVYQMQENSVEPPEEWTPTNAHSWLLVIAYSQYGAQYLEIEPIPHLIRSPLKKIDSDKMKARRSSKQLGYHNDDIQMIQSVSIFSPKGHLPPGHLPPGSAGSELEQYFLTKVRNDEFIEAAYRSAESFRRAIIDYKSKLVDLADILSPTEKEQGRARIKALYKQLKESESNLRGLMMKRSKFTDSI